LPATDTGRDTSGGANRAVGAIATYGSGVVAAELLSRAQAGDHAAFDQLTEPHRRALLAHCYRMLGSFHDAEDAFQDTLLAAWQGIAGFAGRSSVRTWLYRIATNRCLNIRRSASRRQAKAWDVPGVDPPEPTGLGEVMWLEPLPDALLADPEDPSLSPEAHQEQAESLSLAFVTALQVLPSRQVAVLLLREVLGFHADEVAPMLDSTVPAVDSALKRARRALSRHPSASEPPSPSRSSREPALLQEFVVAWESADLHALVGLLTADVFISMPPIPFTYRGRTRPLPFSGPCSTPVDDSTWCRRGPTVSRRSEPTCARPTARVAVPGSTCSPSAGTGSAT
jgi:RNA polymerase sigma-70 factor (TIGR02960 family)